MATEDVLRRLDEALGLIERYAPHHFRRLRRDFSRILVQRYACRGAFFPTDRTCMVELTFTVNRDFSTAQIAATILVLALVLFYVAPLLLIVVSGVAILVAALVLNYFPRG